MRTTNRMRIAARVQAIALALTLVLPLLTVRAAPQPIALEPVFSDFVRALGGADFLGQPISPVVLRAGTRYQYLERGRVEAPVGEDGPVQLTRAGIVLSSGREDTKEFRPLQTPVVNDQTRFFPDTRHSLAYGFREFWDKHGGLTVFGPPISEEFGATDPDTGAQYTVQYFERARLERRPELIGTPKEIQLGAVGKQLYQFYEGPHLPGDMTPVMGVSAPGSPAFGLVAEFVGQPRDKLLNIVGDLGFHWVRQPIQWNGLENIQGNYDFGGLDLMVNDLIVKNIKILFTVSGSPTWATASGDNGAPRDPADFARFMQALAKHFAGRVAAYEVWNEPNLAIEWGPRVDAGAYVEMLRVVTPAIKAADPSALVVAAALGPTGVNDPKLGIDDVRYLEQLEAYQGGVYRYLADVQGVHPYGYRNSPDLLPPDHPNTGEYTNHPSFYFRRIEQVRLAMIRAGDGGRAMWATEWGYGSGNFPEFAGVSDDVQTQWTLQTIDMLRKRYPWVGAMFLWNLNWSVFSPKDVSWGYFSLVDANYAPRAVYYAIRNQPK